MKTDIHPTNYRLVIFQDTSADNARFLIGSTISSSETDTWTDGVEYPLVKVEVSSASHPFYTGNEKVMDTGGRVDKFKKRMEAASDKPAKKAAPKAEEKKEEVVEAPAEEVKEEEAVEVTKEVTETTVEETATEEATPEAPTEGATVEGSTEVAEEEEKKEEEA